MEEAGCQRKIRLIVSRSADLLHGLMKNFREYMVRDVIGKTCIELICHLSPCHLCSAFCHINHTPVYFLYLPGLWRADEIVDAAVSLDNIRGDSSDITVRVVDPRVRDDMFPKIIDADAHEFRRIQRRSSEFRSCRCMGGHTFEVKEDADIRQSGLRPDFVIIARMPGERRIHAVKDSLSCHDRLAVAFFLARASKKDHASRFRMLLKIRFHCKRCRHGSRTEQVVAAAMSVRVLPFGFLSHRAAAFLGQLRKSVIFR